MLSYQLLAHYRVYVYICVFDVGVYSVVLSASCSVQGVCVHMCV